MQYSVSFAPLLTLFLASFLSQGPAKPAAKSVPAAAAAPAARPAPIVWSAARPLTLEDFKSRPTPRDKMAASTMSDIKAKIGCTDFVFTATVQATFIPDESWVREPRLGAVLLAHEQLHFDITELYARKLRQKIDVFRLKADCNKLQPAFNNLTSGVYAEWQREQARYDQETGHGTNAAKQGYWERQVKLKLAQFQAFAQ